MIISYQQNILFPLCHGQEVRTLINDKQSAGFKQVMWDGKNNHGNAVPTGLYIYRIVAGHFLKSNKMMLIK